MQLCKVEAAHSGETQKFPASVREERTLHLSFRVPGQIQELHAEIGQMVRKGEVLARLDPRDFQNAKAAAEADLEEVQAGLNARIANRDRSVEILRKKRDAAELFFQTAEKNLEKFTQLAQEGAIPEIRLDEMRTQHEQALAGKVAAEKELENAEMGLNEEIRSLEAKKKGLLTQKKQAEDALSDTILRAPCTGSVSRKFSECGEITAPGVPILAFTETSRLRVRTVLPEALRIRQNEIAAFRCEFETYPNVSFPADLVFLAQTPQNGTHGYPLEVRVSNLQGKVLFPGMAASVEVEFAPSRNEFCVPLSSLSAAPWRETQAQMPAEYDGKCRETVLWRITSDDRAVPCRVEIVRFVSPGWVIVSGELQAGEVIAASGTRFLREGQCVRPLPE